jgi:hypothetical protein
MFGGRTPGPLALGAIAVIAVLATGVPGQASETPTQTWMRKQLADRGVTHDPVTLTAELREDPILVARVRAEGAEKARIARARRARGTSAGVDQVRATGPWRRDYRSIARQEAVRAGIRDPELFVRQMAAESGYQPCARSYAGAIGIAQIMPDTARSWKVDPHIPESALHVAARQMARYERQLGSYTLALAAYNAGPGAVSVYGGVPPYPETQEYIRRITDRSYPLPGMRQVYTLPGRMEHGFATRLRALQRDVRRNGGRITVTEGWRSYEDQLRIWRAAKRTYGGWRGARMWAAAPGCSNHGRGWAADLAGSLDLARTLAPRHGLVFPMPHEPWHVERAGIPTQSG